MNPSQAQHTVPASAIIGTLQVDDTKVQKKEYFSRLDGCTYYFKDGKCARFEGGTYVTDKKGEIEELDALLRLPGQHLIIDHPVDLPAREGLIMREVQTGAHSGTGIVNTQHLAHAMAGSIAQARPSITTPQK